jgi:hypothetical protein
LPSFSGYSFFGAASGWSGLDVSICAGSTPSALRTRWLSSTAAGGWKNCGTAQILSSYRTSAVTAG